MFRGTPVQKHCYRVLKRSSLSAVIVLIRRYTCIFAAVIQMTIINYYKEYSNGYFFIFTNAATETHMISG